MPSKDIEKYLRLNKLPHIWCPGCGNGIVLGGILRAIGKLNLDQNKVAVISGIGCSSRSAGYVDFNTMHTAHGRAIPVATGLKLARPELDVIVITGDGDCVAIGGNHFIHAARRNINITVIVFNNSIYGMTSGQYSPMTQYGAMAVTSPFGNIEHSFDLCKLAQAAGATYIARTTSYHVHQLPNYVIKAITNKGFSLVEIITHCHTYYGKFNQMSEAMTMLKWQRDTAISLKDAEHLTEEEREKKFIIGEIYNKPVPEYLQEYEKVIEKARQKLLEEKTDEEILEIEERESDCEE
jgi:2-oxoglutarate ferredoxin oxidoreductase subunit beta